MDWTKLGWTKTGRTIPFHTILYSTLNKNSNLFPFLPYTDAIKLIIVLFPETFIMVPPLFKERGSTGITYVLPNLYWCNKKFLSCYFPNPSYWCPLCSKNMETQELMFHLIENKSFLLFYFNRCVCTIGVIPTRFLPRLFSNPVSTLWHDLKWVTFWRLRLNWLIIKT